MTNEREQALCLSKFTAKHKFSVVLDAEGAVSYPAGEYYVCTVNADALQAKLEAAERDAARYRALRDRAVGPLDELAGLFGSALDAAIDAAMRGKP